MSDLAALRVNKTSATHSGQLTASLRDHTICQKCIVPAHVILTLSTPVFWNELCNILKFCMYSCSSLVANFTFLRMTDPTCKTRHAARCTAINILDDHATKCDIDQLYGERECLPRELRIRTFYRHIKPRQTHLFRRKAIITKLISIVNQTNRIYCRVSDLS